MNATVRTIFCVMLMVGERAAQPASRSDVEAVARAREVDG
jgi:hypothetical protein